MRRINLSNQPPVLYKKGESMHGFIFKEVHNLEMLKAVVYVLEHEKTGARMLHFHNEDPDSFLAIGFRTPPYDDTGLPHILEHTVLCGSQKYPIKDPFTELYKTSMATYLNAFTYPDKTVYPCSSMVEKDFFNIASVYCDAVFHPMITENHFKQEGHHFEFSKADDINSDLTINGIVYNEMKGAYSDLNSVIDRYQTKTLFEGGTYGFDSGGDPESIPELTYEKFREFHAKYYHPSNSYIFVYGNLKTEKHLAFFEDILAEYDRIEIDSAIRGISQHKLEITEEIPYPAAEDETRDKNSAVTLNFYTGKVTDSLENLGIIMLDRILLDNSASPLRKALIDSGLGEDLTESGYAAYQLDTFFTAGLKGADAANAEKIKNVIMDTLTDLVKNGIPQIAKERALHQFKFSQRRIKGSFQRSVMDKVFRSWLYDCDPMQNLYINENLELLTKKCLEESGFLEGLIKEKFIDNNHYCLQIFVPDSEYLKKREEKLKAEFAEIKKSFSKDELHKIKEDAALLKKMQSEPNKPENLAKLPLLKLSEVPKETISLGTESIAHGDYKLLYTDVFSNQISYVDLAIDISKVDEELLNYLPLYIELMDNMGAGKYDYVQIAELEEQYTGGISTIADISGTVKDHRDMNINLILSAKCLDENIEKMFEIIKLKLFDFDVMDKKRFKEVITQFYVHAKGKIIDKGHTYSATHAQKNITKIGEVSERLGGVSQVAFFKDLVVNFDRDYERLVDKITNLKKFLLNKNNVVCSYVGDRKNISRIEKLLDDMAGQLNVIDFPEKPAIFVPRYGEIDGVVLPSIVNFNSQVFETISITHKNSPALLYISNYFSYGYLWEEVRVKRGAYGCYAKYLPLDGIFKYFSYRDPEIKETFNAYRRSLTHALEEMDLSSATVEKNIIGTVKTLDSAIRPQATCLAALNKHISGLTDEIRQDFRTRLMELKSGDIKQAIQESLIPDFEKSAKCIIASKDNLDKYMKDNGCDISCLNL